MTPNPYNEEKREQLKTLAENIGQSHLSRSQIHKNRDQTARQLEDQLRTNLNRITDEILHDNTSEIELINRRYAQEVEHIIRAAVNNAYAVGVNYVGESKKIPDRMFTTGTDLGHVKRLTTEFVQTFWRRLAAVLHQKDTITIRNARFSPRSKLSLSNLIGSLAVKIITKSMASGTVSKITQMSTLKDSIKSSVVTDMLVWHTQNDEKVCPLCASLDGMEWTYNDPNMLVPPDDTHDNCRCTLDLKQ